MAALLVLAAAVLGLAALRAAAARLPGRGNAAREAREQEEMTPPAAARDRYAALPATNRSARHWRSCTWWRRTGRGHRDRTRRASRSAGAKSSRRSAGESGALSTHNADHQHQSSRTGAAARKRGSPSWRFLGLWVAGARSAASCILQVVSHRRAAGRWPTRQQMQHDRRRRQARRHPRPAGPRARHERRRRHDLCGALGNRRRRGDGPTPCARARRLQPPRSAQALTGAPRASRARSSTCAVRSRPTRSGAWRALNLDGVGFMKENQPVLSQQGAGGAPARLCRHRQQRPEWTRVGLRLADSRQGRHGPRPDRCATPCVQPVRAAADTGSTSS